MKKNISEKDDFFNNGHLRFKLLLSMKLCFFLLLVSFMQVSAHVYSQERFTLDYTKVNANKIFDKIQKESSYRFFYTYDDIKKLGKININVKDATLPDILNNLLTNGLTWRILQNNMIVISSQNEINAQITVSGTVTDTTGAPLIGVTIKVKGENKGVVTDGGGKFTIVVPENAILEVSYIGYQTMDVPVNDRSEVAIVMKSSISSLSQLVVVGYGTQKRADVTGSIAVISPEQFKSIPVTDVSQALEGKVAGLNITQGSGIPGVSPSILIRGQNSISANTSPLIVLDGVPYSGGLNSINQNDIASISVLKGPSATAIYGTRGSNGVILVTTKKGEKGKARISYNGYVGTGGFAHTLEPASPQQYLDKWKWYQLETNVPQDQLTPVPNSPGGNEYLNYKAGKTVNWLKEIEQPANVTDNNITISGATDNVNYYISGEYMKQDGIIKGYQFIRNNIRASIDAKLTDYLEVGTNLAYNANNYDGGQANLLMAEEMSPYGTLKNPDGTYTEWPMNPEILYTNPLLPLYDNRISRYKRLDGQGYAILKPADIATGLDFLKGLQYRLNTSYSYAPSLNALYQGRLAGSTQNGNASVSSEYDINWLIENILTWQRDFGANHIDFTGLYSAQKFSVFSFNAGAVGFINDLLSYNNLGAGATQSAGSNASSYTLLSQMARVNYSFKNTYLLTLTARRDGYSAFGANTSKYGLFPSVAVGWNISNESFMQNVRAVNNLKIRFGYGQTGNQAISPNQTTTTDRTVLYPFNGLTTIGTVPNVLGNADLHWETSTTGDLGVDFAIVNGRISGTIDLYHTDTKGLLLQRQLPVITGYSSVWANLGETANQGIEVTLNTTNIKSHNFTWTSDIVFASNRNRIVNLYGDKKSDLGNRWFIGEPIHVIYDYKKIGVWQNSAKNDAAIYHAKPGDLRFEDVNGDSVINSSDMMILGSPDPKWTGGIANTFTYKSFSLRVFIQTVQGVLQDNPQLSWLDLAGRRNIPAGLTYWTPENNNNNMPALSYTNTYGYGFAQNASYTRLRDVTLTYTLSQNTLKKTGLGGLSVYLSGTNLYTWTPWFGWDPETTYQPRGVSSFATNFPLERSVVLGVNISLR
jgi:TonB-linked SusC/RagA family outer membrane protein